MGHNADGLLEPGRRYPEAAVDAILKSVFDDRCALRRYLVNEEFMSRDTTGVYWRAGRTVRCRRLRALAPVPGRNRTRRPRDRRRGHLDGVRREHR